MATLLTNKPRFYNNDGTLASGGKLYTYYAGTSTPISTYSDAAETTPNTNPVILDAKGEADIWVTGVIKINLLQSDDVQVTGYPIDNVNYPAVTMWTDRGNFDASVNTYPTTGGSGVSGAILTGDVWTISVVATGGSLNGELVGTTVRALTDTPAQVDANWEVLDVGLGASNAAAVAAAVSTAADLVLTNADVVLTHADVVLTNADVVSTNADAASCLSYAQAMSLNATTDTSSSSVAIGTGAKTFTVTAGKSFVPGMFLVIADTAAPSTNSMYGQITSYATDQLVMNILSVLGSGTKAAWTISQTSAANLNVDTATTAITATDVTGSAVVTGAISSSSPSSGIGYATGAGGAVTQLTSITTGVTLNKICGTITTVSNVFTANQVVSFELSNTAIAVDDVVVVTLTNLTTFIVTTCSAYASIAGRVRIQIFYPSASSSASVSLIINFAVIKAVSS